ncbi:alpha/beta fold hydrolase [Egicoccus halophilus]|uniref:Alpha/beta hydrolase n=1 Tax=Egicoccus halophilus TaxID=1670830 RepID=A0A8J3A9R5_9ACTN|nr:alpha/beta hydrolase [Egicoccus halophilus]GGI07852.1 hypothetical protein GCM10011354_26160 [Egicoccus halophilus]
MHRSPTHEVETDVAYSALLHEHEVTFEDVGGEGPPILLTPGVDTSASQLAARFTAFATIYRVIAWNPPPVLDSDATREHARLALALLHHVGIERSIFGGDGPGALVGLRAGLFAPDRVRGVLLFDLPAHDADEYARLDELDIPTVVVHAPAAPGTRSRASLETLTSPLRDARGVHLLEGDDHALAPARAGTVDLAIRDYLESLPA